MKTDLYETLGARADRVNPDIDVDAFLRDVRSRAESNGRNRNSSLAAGGGVVAVLALVAGTIALTSPGAGDSNRQPAGSGPTVSASPATSSANPAVASRAAAAQRAVQVALAREQAEAAARARARAGQLVPIKPAPASAPLSVSLAPKAWHYLASGPASVLYGPRNTPDPNDPNTFIGKLALLVGMRYPGQGPLPLTIGPYRASYDDSDGSQDLNLAVTKKIVVTIQVPAKAHLSRTEVIDLAKTLDIRDISHPSAG